MKKKLAALAWYILFTLEFSVAVSVAIGSSQTSFDKANVESLMAAAGASSPYAAYYNCKISLILAYSKAINSLYAKGVV